MLDEEREEADAVVFELGELGHNGVGDQVAAARARGERELFLEPVVREGELVWKEGWGLG